jgi:hypothetical protein
LGKRRLVPAHDRLTARRCICDHSKPSPCCPPAGIVSSLALTLETTSVDRLFVTEVYAVAADSGGPLSLALQRPNRTECVAEQVWSATGLTLDVATVRTNDFGFKVLFNDTVMAANSTRFEVQCASVMVNFDVPPSTTATTTASGLTGTTNDDDGDNNDNDNNANNNNTERNNAKNNNNNNDNDTGTTTATNNNHNHHIINTPYIGADAETIDIDNDACACCFHGVVFDSHRHQFAATDTITTSTEATEVPIAPTTTTTATITTRTSTSTITGTGITTMDSVSMSPPPSDVPTTCDRRRLRSSRRRDTRVWLHWALALDDVAVRRLAWNRRRAAPRRRLVMRMPMLTTRSS